MVTLKLRWSREHAIDFCKRVTECLSSDKDTEYFGVTFNLDSCNIQIENGEIKQ